MLRSSRCATASRLLSVYALKRRSIRSGSSFVSFSNCPTESDRTSPCDRRHRVSTRRLWDSRAATFSRAPRSHCVLQSHSARLRSIAGRHEPRPPLTFPTVRSTRVASSRSRTTRRSWASAALGSPAANRFCGALCSNSSPRPPASDPSWCSELDAPDATLRHRTTRRARKPAGGVANFDRRDRPFEPRVLVTQLIDLANLARSQLSVFFLPGQHRIDVNAGFRAASSSVIAVSTRRRTGAIDSGECRLCATRDLRNRAD